MTHQDEFPDNLAGDVLWLEQTLYDHGLGDHSVDRAVDELIDRYASAQASSSRLIAFEIAQRLVSGFQLDADDA